MLFLKDSQLQLQLRCTNIIQILQSQDRVDFRQRVPAGRSGVNTTAIEETTRKFVAKVSLPRDGKGDVGEEMVKSGWNTGEEMVSGTGERGAGKKIDSGDDEREASVKMV